MKNTSHLRHYKWEVYQWWNNTSEYPSPNMFRFGLQWNPKSHVANFQWVLEGLLSASNKHTRQDKCKAPPVSDLKQHIPTLATLELHLTTQNELQVKSIHSDPIIYFSKSSCSISTRKWRVFVGCFPWQATIQ